MASYKFVVSDPKSKKSYQFEIEQGKAGGLVGKKIGEDFDGDFMGLSGYTLQVTGGSDKDGFPMIKDVNGPAKKKILLTKAPGFHPDIQGKRKRKTIRGNTISEDTMQINTKVVKAGGKTLDEITGKTATPADAPKEEKAEAKADTKPEAKADAKPAPEPAKKEDVKPAEKPAPAPAKEEKKAEPAKEDKKEEPKKEAPAEKPAEKKE